jgi:peptidoglycan lytic transglycosylase G
MARRRRIGFTTAVGMAAFLAVLAGIVHVQYAPPDPEGVGGGGAVIEVPAGATLRQTAGLLKARHLIRNATLFEWLARARGLAARVQPGEYAMSPAMTPREILDRLVRGEVVLHPVTIPEGLTVAETLARLEAAGFGPEAAYWALLDDPAFQAAHGVPTEGVKVPFEGYLFPDTYLLAKGTPPARVLAVMLARLDAAFTPERQRAMAGLGWNRHQVLTLASMIEKETARPEERARVSAVFHNRLALGMRLQADPTVIYAIPGFDGDIRHADLVRDDPYNTYRYAGLPPGPIANPGDAAIQAALFPDADDALYFVARGDGTHVFSTTVEAHNRAVRELVR